MPATRSRTENWRDCLAKIQERGGALEISVARNPVWLPTSGAEVHEAGSDVIWRVKVIRVIPEGIVVEAPSAFGETIKLKPGVCLIGAMTIGQNRWMFHTRVVSQSSSQRGLPEVVLASPDGVERCTRRSFYRITTADLNLPDVQCWPLMDPTSVVAAEAANRLQIKDALSAQQSGEPIARLGAMGDPVMLPDVGPMFRAKLVNLSGGGMGIRIAPEDSVAAQRRPHLWLRVDLRPGIPAPVAFTARLAHTHIDSTQSLYAGMAFEFSFNVEHRKFVVDLFAKYIDDLQSGQLRMAKAG